MQVILALNYGGRNEIVRAVKRIMQSDAGKDLKNITEDRITENLDNSDIPAPDLIIRTAGEYRTSNFLLWQAAYSEYYVTQVLWPDFSVEDFKSALESYSQRERRFGAVKK